MKNGGSSSASNTSDRNGLEGLDERLEVSVIIADENELSISYGRAGCPWRKVVMHDLPGVVIQRLQYALRNVLPVPSQCHADPTLVITSFAISAETFPGQKLLSLPFVKYMTVTFSSVPFPK